MAFDPNVHEIHPVSGLIVDKVSGHIVGVETATPKSTSTEFPKWVVPHPSHVVGRVAPEFSDTHVARDGGLTVLVRDLGEEATALAEKVVAVAEAPLAVLEHEPVDFSEPESIAHEYEHND